MKLLDKIEDVQELIERRFEDWKLANDTIRVMVSSTKTIRIYFHYGAFVHNRYQFKMIDCCNFEASLIHLGNTSTSDLLYELTMIEEVIAELHKHNKEFDRIQSYYRDWTI